MVMQPAHASINSDLTYLSRNESMLQIQSMAELHFQFPYHGAMQRSVPHGAMLAMIEKEHYLAIGKFFCHDHP